MEYKNIVYKKEDRIAKITLNRPDQLNALSHELLDELEAAVREADRDNEVRVVILKGAGRAFSAGYDLGQEAGAGMPESIWTDRLHVTGLYKNVFTIRDISKPVIAQVHGYCIGGGTLTAMACDLTVVADDSQIGTYPLIGPLGAAGIGAMLSFFVGTKKAKELSFVIGKTIDGKEAERIGLVNMAVPYGELEEEVEKLARTIAKTPLELLVLEKQAINRAQDVMGLRTAVLWSMDLDNIAHYTEPVQQFAKMIAERGVKQAREWWRSSA